jgi:ElaB/YqjD/DUF883 family membrane-anchored ribosome-binding protein
MSDTAAHIEREVEAHRAGVENTLDRLKGRMSMEQMVDDVGQFIGMDDVRGTLRTAGAQVRENPIALGLIGVGLVWLMMGRSSSSKSSHDEAYGDYGQSDRSTAYTPYSGAWPASAQGDGAYGGTRERGMMAKASDAASDMAGRMGDRMEDMGDRIGDTAQGLTAKVSDAASKVRHMASDAVEKVKSTVGSASHSASSMRHGATSLTDPVMRRMESNPLMLGAVALVAGTVIGAALPRTRTEDRLMGQQRDSLMDEAREAGMALKDRAAEAAKSTYGAAVRAARDEGLVPGAESSLVDKVGHIASAAVEEAKAQVEPILHGETKARSRRA